MELSDRSKILILIVLVAIVLYLLFNSNKSPVHNEGMLTQDVRVNPQTLNVVDTDSDNSLPTNMDKDEQSNDSSDDAKIGAKMALKNSSQNGEYKRVNYIDGKRQAKSSSLDNFFEGNGPMDNDDQSGFVPADDGGKFASYLPGKNNGRKLSDKDKFNPVSLLPNEDDEEWFDNPHKSNTVSVKSRHLLNVTRPIGVNTIGQSLKNANRQLRPDPANPKVPVSPWSNSSIEPDNNIRSMCI